MGPGLVEGRLVVRAAVLALFCLIGVVILGNAGCVSPPASSEPSTTLPAGVKFPGVTHQAGAQHVLTAGQVDAASAQGLTLSMNYGPVRGTLATQMTNKGMKYLDRTIADLIYAVCPPSSGCTLTTAQENSIVADATTYLNANKNDPLIAGYYILDDWPGNVSNALKRITAAAHAVTPSKPTVCAFVGILDFWPNANHTGQPYQSHSAFDRAIANYTPAGCDIADFYVYGVPGEIGGGIGCVLASNVDWSGKFFIPHMKSQLVARGWTPSMGFMISPQTFNLGSACADGDHPQPTAANITTETAVFCQAGASSTLAYIWDHFGVGEYLANRADWQAGYQEGVRQCKTIWANKG